MQSRYPLPYATPCLIVWRFSIFCIHHRIVILEYMIAKCIISTAVYICVVIHEPLIISLIIPTNQLMISFWMSCDIPSVHSNCSTSHAYSTNCCIINLLPLQPKVFPKPTTGFRISWDVPLTKLGDKSVACLTQRSCLALHVLDANIWHEQLYAHPSMGSL